MSHFLQCQWKFTKMSKDKFTPNANFSRYSGISWKSVIKNILQLYQNVAVKKVMDQFKLRKMGWKVFWILQIRHPIANLLTAVNSSYDDDLISVKDCEHTSRAGPFDCGSKNVYPNTKNVFPTASDFSSMFKNKANKRLIPECL